MKIKVIGNFKNTDIQIYSHITTGLRIKKREMLEVESSTSPIFVFIVLQIFNFCFHAKLSILLIDIISSVIKYIIIFKEKIKYYYTYYNNNNFLQR